MTETETEVSLNLHRQGKTLVCSVPDPLTEEVVHILKRDVYEALKNLSLSSVVFDFSAVDSVDTGSLQECEQLIEGSKLLGAEVAVAALKPHVAATIVDLGDFFVAAAMVRSVHAAIQSFDRAMP